MSSNFFNPENKNHQIKLDDGFNKDFGAEKNPDRFLVEQKTEKVLNGDVIKNPFTSKKSSAETGWILDTEPYPFNKMDDLDKHFDPISFFEGLSDQEKVAKLLKGFARVQVEYLLQNLSSFEGVDHNQIVVALVREGHRHRVRDYFSEFRELTEETAKELLRCGLGKYIAKNPQSFSGISKEFWVSLAEKGWTVEMLENISFYKDILPFDLIDSLIEDGYTSTVVTYAVSSPEEDRKKVVEKLISGDFNIAPLVHNLESFPEIDRSELVKILISKGGPGLAIILRNISKFKDVNRNALAEMVLSEIKPKSSYYDFISPVIQNLSILPESFHSLIAIQLIYYGFGQSVVENLPLFKGLDLPEIAYFLIGCGEGALVSRNIEKFPGSVHWELVYALVEDGYINELVKNLKKFKDVNYEDVIKRILDKDIRWGFTIKEYLSEFDGLSQETLEKIEIGSK